MRRSLLVVMSTLVILFFLSPPLTITQAEELSKKDSTVGIQFEKGKMKKQEETKPPLIDGGSNKPPVRLLPKTGEMLTSLIIILLGVSIVIFSLGVLALRELLKNNIKEAWR